MLKKVLVLKGKKTGKLICIRYQDADTTEFYKWDAVIEDQKTMKAIDKLCEDFKYTGSYKQRAHFEGYLEYNDILAAIGK